MWTRELKLSKDACHSSRQSQGLDQGWEPLAELVGTHYLRAPQPAPLSGLSPGPQHEEQTSFRDPRQTLEEASPRVWPRIPSSWGLLPARDVSCLNRSFQFLRLQHASTQHGNSPSRSWPQGADSCCAWQRPRLVHVTALMGRAPGTAADRVAK